MFEKEAEEYVSEYQGYGWQPHKGSAVFAAMVDCYETGAEFGYNKAKEEMQAQIEKMRNYQNCDYQSHIVDCPIFKSGGHISCKKCPHWILQATKEND